MSRASAPSVPHERGHRGAGRIPLHQREFDDNIPVLGENIVVADADGALGDAIHNTISLGMSIHTRRNYRNRIAKIAQHWKDRYPEYYAIGVRSVSPEEQRDRSKYYFQHTEDLEYNGLNVKFLIYFLLSTEKRSDGKYKSFDDLRKYRDAVLWGSKIAGKFLPSRFYSETENFLSAYKKKVAMEKKKVMWMTSARTQFRCRCIVFCSVDPSKQIMFSRGPGRCCNGTVWPGVPPLTVLASTTSVWAWTP